MNKEEKTVPIKCARCGVINFFGLPRFEQGLFVGYWCKKCLQEESEE